MALKHKEIAISKAVSVKLDDSTVAIIAHIYHTADKSANPDDKSWYKYAGKVIRIDDAEAEVALKSSPAERLKTWTWKCPAWPEDMFFGYDGSNLQDKEAKWLRMRLKKALDWDSYVRLVRDGIRRIARSNCEKEFPSGRYETDGYIDTDGKTFSIIDQDALKARLGKVFWKDCILKRDLPKESKQKA